MHSNKGAVSRTCNTDSDVRSLRGSTTSPSCEVESVNTSDLSVNGINPALLSSSEASSRARSRGIASISPRYSHVAQAASHLVRVESKRAGQGSKAVKDVLTTRATSTSVLSSSGIGNRSTVLPLPCRGQVISVMAVIAVIGVTILVVNSSTGVVVLWSASDTAPVEGFNTGLAADMATTIRELGDFVSTVKSVDSSSSCSRISSFSNSDSVCVECSGVGKDSSALGHVLSVTFKNTATIEGCTSYLN